MQSNLDIKTWKNKRIPIGRINFAFLDERGNATCPGQKFGPNSTV